MAVRLPVGCVVTLVLILGVMSVRGSGFGFPRALTLERGLPAGMPLEALRAHDKARHGRRILLADSDGVIDFPVGGSGDPFTVGLYYTRVKLGNPAKEFYVQIDTGSDILWVTCDSCSGCPTTSGLNIPLAFFDIKKSSTASQITCSDDNCISAIQTGEATCQSYSSSSFCGYTFQYGDGSGTIGYYVSDTIYFGKFIGGERTTNSSATVIFGCSYSQSGDLTKSDRAVDGIFGFGQQALSVISQLSSQGVAPSVFSHCLRGPANGGGILVLGEIVEPGIVYTPMVPSQPHYNVNLTRIAVNGKTVPIDRSVFLTTTKQGTIIDSGTTLAYLAEQAYDPFVNAINDAISSSVKSIVAKGNQCYITASSPEDVFPSVTLYFDGGASMILKPQDYLLQQNQINTAVAWCIGWQKNTGEGTTILGDLVLKDKIFVYDIANQRIGWKAYDCSLSVNVSTTSGKSEFVNTEQPNQSGSSRTLHFNLLNACIAVFLAHIFAYADAATSQKAISIPFVR